MKLRLQGTPAECARLVFLLRYGPPEIEVLEVSQRYRSRHNPEHVRVYVEVGFAREPGPVARTFYRLIDPDGTPLLTDAWGAPIARGEP
jgi:hypothetical protein